MNRHERREKTSNMRRRERQEFRHSRQQQIEERAQRECIELGTTPTGGRVFLKTVEPCLTPSNETST